MTTQFMRSELDGSPPRGWGKRKAPADSKSRDAVHPHAGGENVAPSLICTAVFGSPPRGWGKRPQSEQSVVLVRFTPTRVGKTCGIHMMKTFGSGSPPRGWGKHAASYWNLLAGRFTPTRVGKTFLFYDDCQIIRFTPTRVGKTQISANASPWSSVHPHAGGENDPITGGGHSCLGSPPRGWGKRTHPSCLPPLHGSPPRGWGKLAQPGQEILPLRFTPTRVGKTPAARRWLRSWLVHPHAGGENAGPLAYTIAIPGSPPRGWGKRDIAARACRTLRFTPTRVGKTQPIGHGVQAQRFTPTRVGKTYRYDYLSNVHTVHPHAGGENLPSIATSS